MAQAWLLRTSAKFPIQTPATSLKCPGLSCRLNIAEANDVWWLEFIVLTLNATRLNCGRRTLGAEERRRDNLGCNSTGWRLHCSIHPDVLSSPGWCCRWSWRRVCGRKPQLAKFTAGINIIRPGLVNTSKSAQDQLTLASYMDPR